MSESEWIKKYPFCFKAFLNDEYANILGVYFEDEKLYPESMFGAYLNWFLSKTGKDQEITRLKKALEIANEKFALIDASFGDSWLIEKYSKEAQKQIKEVIDNENKN